LLLLLLVGYLARTVHNHRSAPASTSRASAPASTAVPLSRLPVQARETVALIRVGGPFPYTRDGAVFGNVEGRLPKRPSGYYHEYTVPTPGAADRGARRIIAGARGELYYTADHYETFVRVDVTG
jgi:ribonuclease T1